MNGYTVKGSNYATLVFASLLDGDQLLKEEPALLGAKSFLKEYSPRNKFTLFKSRPHFRMALSASDANSKSQM